MRMVNKCVDPTSVLFLLSRWYAEDCERLRLLQPLKSLRGHPVDILVSSMDQRAWRLINSSAPRFIPKEIFSTTDHVWCRKRGSGRQAPSFPTIHSHHVPPFKTTNSTARVVDTVSLLVSCPRHKSRINVPYTPKHSYPTPEAQDMPKRVSSQSVVPATFASRVRL